ncbi:hypothetical protein [Streptomyces sp. NPDC024089]|uniref:hypothetical protein n=1 Tax=Streptomyces sp. NPDC024089 TaxID=3154328 RepID=UPI0033BFD272
MDSVADIADDLEHAWATRPPDQSVTDWEVAHLRPVREQVHAVEKRVFDLERCIASGPPPCSHSE